jgi:hypothetical protein
MDMRERGHLQRWLTNGVIERLYSGEYEGTILTVVEKSVRNRFTSICKVQPVVVFEDDWCMIPNTAMRAVLCEMFGYETSVWVGRRIKVFLQRTTKISSQERIRRFVRSVTHAGVDVQHEIGQSRADVLRTMPYAAYRQTDWWQAKRREALEVAGNRCQVCNAAESLDVHHRTYERRGAELPGDLIVLCRQCHELFHRERRLCDEQIAEQLFAI